MSEYTTVPGDEGKRFLSCQMAEHEPLVRWVVRRQWLGSLPFEDALQEGRIGLWSALCHYDPDRGTAFSTYAVPAITHTVWRAVALEQRRFACSGTDLASPMDLNGDEAIDRAQVYAVLRDLVDQLPLHLRRIVVAHHGFDQQPPQTLAAIARSLGVSRQRVHQLHGQAILWLAHPAHSLQLRRLIERCHRRDYQVALARQSRAARQQRRRRAGR